ncbi:hypothetical protein HGRIS_010227 [Hohenbuehelia grisea]
MLIGFTLKTLLQGMIFVQGYMYYTRFPKDRLLIKLVVGFLIAADTLNVVLNTIFFYDSLIIHFNDPLSLLTTDWMFATDPMLMGITACIVQLFFAWRIKVLSGNFWVVIPVMVFAIASCSGAIACGIGNFIVKNFRDFPKLTPFLITWLGGSSGIASTDILLDRIIAIILPTGLLQAAVAILNLGLAFGFSAPTPNSGGQFVVNFFLSKLFTNSLLSSLNSRDPKGSSTVISSQGNRPFDPAPPSRSSRSSFGDYSFNQVRFPSLRSA